MSETVGDPMAGPRAPRRVITAMRQGRAVFAEDGPVPNAHHYTAIPGMMTSVVYATAAPPPLLQGEAEAAPPGLHIPPGPGETRLMVVTSPPDTTMARPEFDPAAADAEQRERIPGLAELLEPDVPGMHRTETVDYDIVLDGEIWLELDDGATAHLHRGDIAVQCGTRHAWRHKGDCPATLCFVLIGGAPA
ncbi:cupin domain-containing protein [Streptomyces sp. CA-249302]|uniref:cupin domain-containing protein n=1 Tax=Streptomyces sp. CA-249302 TaxID=3240058 RepID=UPI003D8B3CCD